MSNRGFKLFGFVRKILEKKKKKKNTQEIPKSKSGGLGINKSRLTRSKLDMNHHKWIPHKIACLGEFKIMQTKKKKKTKSRQWKTTMLCMIRKIFFFFFFIPAVIFLF